MMYWYFFLEIVVETKEIKRSTDGTLRLDAVPYVNYKVTSKFTGDYYDWYGIIEGDFVHLIQKRYGFSFEVPKGYAEPDKSYYLSACINYSEGSLYSIQGRLLNRYCTYKLVKKYINTEYRDESIIKIPKDLEKLDIEKEFFEEKN